MEGRLALAKLLGGVEDMAIAAFSSQDNEAADRRVEIRSTLAGDLLVVISRVWIVRGQIAQHFDTVAQTSR
jgi:hypothetical protein